MTLKELQAAVLDALGPEALSLLASVTGIDGDSFDMGEVARRVSSSLAVCALCNVSLEDLAKAAIAYAREVAADLPEYVKENNQNGN